jgi:hypothetical protein
MNRMADGGLESTGVAGRRAVRLSGFTVRGSYSSIKHLFDVSLDECRPGVLETRTGVRSNIGSIPSQEASMTAVTFHRPVSIPSQRRPALQLVRSPEAVPTLSPSVHLTRRGRIVVLLALVAGGLLVMLTLTGLFGGSAVAGTTPTHPATRMIVVQPGQTLWSIAGQIAPHADRRDTIARIVELNAMPNSGVSAGARIAVPTP